MTTRLDGRRILVTGASGGLGLAIAKTLGREGAQLWLAGTLNTPLTARMIESFSSQRRAEYEQFVKTSFALGRLGQPADVAALVLFLASRDADWVTGSVFTIDGGLSTN